MSTYDLAAAVLRTRDAETHHRLRRLDALFAEKVLGFTTAIDPLDGESILFQTHHKMWGKIPIYTRSLDAAWEGAKAAKVDFAVKQFASGGAACFCFYGVRHNAEVRGAHVCMWADVASNASHPAEALVLACLRAVGCTEEELV